jgi:hypothetical protein
MGLLLWRLGKEFQAESLSMGMQQAIYTANRSNKIRTQSSWPLIRGGVACK